VLRLGLMIGSDLALGLLSRLHLGLGQGQLLGLEFGYV
jgi:hypothetical protein